MKTRRVSLEQVKLDVEVAFVALKGKAYLYDPSPYDAFERVVTFLAQCESEPTTDDLIAALRARLKAMGDEDRHYALEAVARGYCLDCGSDEGGSCVCMRDE